MGIDKTHPGKEMEGQSVPPTSLFDRDPHGTGWDQVQQGRAKAGQEVATRWPQGWPSPVMDSSLPPRTKTSQNSGLRVFSFVTKACLSTNQRLTRYLKHAWILRRGRPERALYLVLGDTGKRPPRMAHSGSYQCEGLKMKTNCVASY